MRKEDVEKEKKKEDGMEEEEEGEREKQNRSQEMRCWRPTSDSGTRRARSSCIQASQATPLPE